MELKWHCLTAHCNELLVQGLWRVNTTCIVVILADLTSHQKGYLFMDGKQIPWVLFFVCAWICHLCKRDFVYGTPNIRFLKVLCASLSVWRSEVINNLRAGKSV